MKGGYDGLYYVGKHHQNIYYWLKCDIF